MSIYKKWLNIAMIFMLLISLISPSAALADEIDSTEFESLITDNLLQTTEDSSQLSPDTIPSSTTSDSTELLVTSSNVDEPIGNVIISVEKFTLGQGYAVAPVQVPIYSGDMVGHVVARLLGDGNYNDGVSEENISYLANIRDNASVINIPQYIQTVITNDNKEIGDKFEAEWLGQFDYTQMSGWMFTVNDQPPNVGMNVFEPKNEDVIRLQFTVYGSGADLGFSEAYINVANKDALTAEIAKINSNPNKAELLANAAVKSAYDTAYELLVNMESSQEHVDATLEQLKAALAGKGTELEADKTALQTALDTANQNKESVKVSADGKEIEPTAYWLTQAQLDTYVAVILSAQQLLADEAATQEAIDATVLALNQATDTFEQAKQAGLKTEAAVETEVKFTVAPKAVSLKLYDTNNQEVAIGAGEVGTYNVYTANLLAGDYRYEGFNQENKSVGSGKLTITAEPKQAYEFRQLNFKASNSGWVVNEDYTLHIGQDHLEDTSLKFGDITSSGQTPVLALVGKTLFYTLTPHTKHDEMMEFSDKVEVKIGTSAQSMTKAIAFSGNVKFTVPEEAELFIGQKSKHFVEFTEQKPEAVVSTDGLKTYSYKLLENKEYNYRVSQAGKLTNTGVFKASAQNKALEITKEQLEIVSPKAILNKGTNLEGNLYLNINAQNHLKLNQGEQFKLLPLRSWQALIEGMNNYFFEPDFHYEVIQGEDVVAIEPGKPGSYATVTALKNGTAIIKVTYDALKVNGSTYVKDANDAFSAIWPENVGLFVVTVGQGETGISTGILSNEARNKKANETVIKNLQNGIFDADIDSVYYAEGEKGAYFTFTPTAGSTVSVLRPEINHAAGTVSYGATFSTEDVTTNPDSSTTVLLVEGRNIVKVEKDGQAEYHVMTARPLDIKIENVTRPNEKIGAGDQVKVTFNGLSFPANKLAGIYNFRGQLQFDGGPEKTLISGSAVQYNLTTSGNSVTFKIPENHVGDYHLQDGRIGLSYFGSPIGDHRNIDPAVGKNPNFNAVEVEGYYSIFPEIKIIEQTLVETTDKTTLQASIEKAEKNKADVKVSTDGKDMEQAAYWVTQAELDTYVAVLLSAQQLLTDEAATQEAIDATVLALNQASASFEQAKKAGLKADVTYTTEQAYNSVGKYMLENLPNPSFGNEWWIITLARGGYTVPAGYYDTYYQNVVEHVVSNKGVLDKRKYTEYSRLIIALTAIGKDPTNVGGYNLIDQLANFDKVVWQGVNGAYYALIALDTKHFELPTTATTTREKLIDFILNQQLQDKGWTLSGTKANLDMTAMAIQSLAPYYTSNPQVKQAVDQALTTLASLQAENQSQSVESIAQAVTALTSLGIDPNKDPRFSKVIENIMTYYNAEDGGFKHVLTETATNGMATEQVGYTLAAYHRLLNGKVPLYDMSDMKLDVPSTPSEEEGNNPSKPDDNKAEDKPNVPGNEEGNNSSKPDDGEEEQPEQPIVVNNVSMSIAISKTEIILPTEQFEITADETAYSLLKRVTQQKQIQLNDRITSMGVYVAGIAGVNEFDFGALSGWMYSVNGKFPEVSADAFTLTKADQIKWLYTKDLGNDIDGGEQPTSTEPEKNPTPSIPEDKEEQPGEKEEIPEDKEQQPSTPEKPEQDQAPIIKDIEQTVQQAIQQPVTFGSEWDVVALARSHVALADTYFDTYYQQVVKKAKESNGVFAGPRTEHSRVILALSAIGKDATNVGGYNLFEPLHDFNRVTAQGINGSIFALLAFDAQNYTPKFASMGRVASLTANASNFTTREKLIQHILSNEIAGGGFALSGTTPDADITAMALQALVPYKNQSDVQAAIDRALHVLSAQQLANAGFVSNRTENVQSAAQVLIALSALNIDAATDARFVKNGQTILDNIQTFAASSGGYKHPKDGAVNAMATQQAAQGLIAYERFVSGKPSLFTMKDVVIQAPEQGEKEPTTPVEDHKPTIPTQPDVSEQIGMVYTTIQIDSSSTPLSMTPVDLKQGDSAFDLLVRVTNMHGIPLSYRLTSYGVYIDGINGIYEFDRGPLSGWMYRVNGVFPSYSADLYTLQPNDVVEWLYTEDLGKDIGGYVEDTTTKKPKDEPKQPVTDDKQPSPIEAVDVTVGATDWKLDRTTIQQYTEQNKQVITLQLAPEVVVEIPMSALQQIQLQDDEYVQVTVDVKGNSISTSVVVTHGETKKPWFTGKDYVKVKVSAFPVTANSVVAQLVNNELRAVPHKIENGEMVIFTKGSGEFTVTEKAVTFNDIAKHANKVDIETLANRFIVNGKDAATFAPNAAITRAQFGAMISRALGLTANESAVFTDTKGKWYEQEIQALVEAGITKGKTASTFDPESAMTRQQAAAFMANILAYVGYEAQSTELTYVDASAIQNQYKDAVALLASLGIMTGKKDGTFDANGQLTRAQMAKILKRTLQVAGLL